MDLSKVNLARYTFSFSDQINQAQAKSKLYILGGEEVSLKKDRLLDSRLYNHRLSPHGTGMGVSVISFVCG